MQRVNFKTPQVPDKIKNIRHPNYKNIYEYKLGNKNLWGTETLLGDWDGEYLLVAKDFYPSSYIEDNIAYKVSNPYCHAEGIPTNRNLVYCLTGLEKLRRGFKNTDCGFLYVSACFLLRADGQKSGALPDQDEALALSAPVLQFTLENMRNVKAVVLMGKEAQSAFKNRLLSSVVQSRGLRTRDVPHPAARVSATDQHDAWSKVFSI
jgi:uracil-DNA glycosylase